MLFRQEIVDQRDRWHRKGYLYFWKHRLHTLKIRVEHTDIMQALVQILISKTYLTSLMCIRIKCGIHQNSTAGFSEEVALVTPTPTPKSAWFMFHFHSVYDHVCRVYVNEMFQHKNQYPTQTSKTRFESIYESKWKINQVCKYESQFS